MASQVNKKLVVEGLERLGLGQAVGQERGGDREWAAGEAVAGEAAAGEAAADEAAADEAADFAGAAVAATTGPRSARAASDKGDAAGDATEQQVPSAKSRQSNTAPLLTAFSPPPVTMRVAANLHRGQHVHEQVTEVT